MRLQDAIKKLNEGRARTGRPFSVSLRCGFTPLHLQTFIMASLLDRLPSCSVACGVGVYGDLLGSLRSPLPEGTDAVAVVVEWGDLDPRLGLRSVGGWGREVERDVLDLVPERLHALSEAIEAIQQNTRVVVAPPTLPLPPLFTTVPAQGSAAELEIRALLAQFAARIARGVGAAVMNPAAVDAVSPHGERHDAKNELVADFPYKLPHAAALGELFAGLLLPSSPLKGIVTDLDNTLWAGLVGEIGASEVSWSLDKGTHGHALYQQALKSLSESGVLLGVASKNQREIALGALQRSDILVPQSCFFPLEIGWNAKSESLKAIIAAWNVGADSVVFIDDTPMELAEVDSALLGVTTLRFPTGNAEGILALIRQLRTLFGKARVYAEDSIRMDSIRQSAERHEAMAGSPRSVDEFLAGAQATVTAEFRKEPFDTRALELVNKTNQFNLNGLRVEQTRWLETLSRWDTFLLTVSYADRFGPLGKIAVIAGRQVAGEVVVNHLVLSCRAFSRRVEHQIVRLVFQRFDVERLSLDFRRTDRNMPVAEFLSQYADLDGPGLCVLERGRFESNSPSLHHDVEINDGLR